MSLRFALRRIAARRMERARAALIRQGASWDVVDAYAGVHHAARLIGDAVLAERATVEAERTIALL